MPNTRICGCPDTHLHQRQEPHRCFECNKCVVGKVRKLTNRGQSVTPSNSQVRSLTIAKHKRLVRP